MLEHINSIIVIITGLLTVISYFLVSVKAFAKLETKIEILEKDLNNLKQITKQMVNTETWILRIQITHIQEFLEKHDSYHPPTLDKYDD